MIKILSVPHCLFEATNMARKLTNMGYPAKMVDKVNTYDRSLHIIYNAAGVDPLPKNYIVCQTEIAGSHFFGPKYFKALKNARAVWEYAEENIKHYEHCTSRICIVKPGIHPQETGVKDIQWLFYGWLKGSDRRIDALEKIQRTIPIEVITNKLGPAMWNILRRTNQVVNIHYYDHSPLELYRLHESLSFGCDVWLHDEQRFYTCNEDNTPAILNGLQLAGYSVHSVQTK